MPDTSHALIRHRRMLLACLAGAVLLLWTGCGRHAARSSGQSGDSCVLTDASNLCLQTEDNAGRGSPHRHPDQRQPSTADKQPRRAAPAEPASPTAEPREAIDQKAAKTASPLTDATGALMAAIGRQQLQRLLAQPGELIAACPAGAEARAAGLRSCRVERVALPTPITLPDGSRLDHFQRIVIDGDLPTRAYPAQVCLDGRPLATLHPIGDRWVAASGSSPTQIIGRRVAIAYGPTGLDAGFADPLQIPDEDTP